MNRTANKKFFFFLTCISLGFSSTARQSTPAKQQLLDSVTMLINNKTYNRIDAVLIAHKGQMVYEEYFNGFHKDSLHDSRSAFKSITALLTGIAIDKGYIKSVREKVYPVFRDYGMPKGKRRKEQPAWLNDPRKNDMTIQHLLEMKSGFDCEEFFDGKDCEDSMFNTKDWIAYSLQLPMVHQPGTAWQYTSINPMLLSGVIAQASRMSVPDFAAHNLFRPLDITHYRWTIDPSGNAMTAGSFYILPADMMKIGQLVANKGKWNNQQLISSQWIREATKPITRIDSFSFVGSSGTKAGRPQPTYYGYAWYTEQLVNDTVNETVQFASGNGGQYIMIIERLQLVIVFMGSNYNNYRSKMPFELLLKYIIPAFSSPTAS